ncbi:PEP-CTERM sorting domain-containing protein [Thalassomonas sp. RHCl1]|uniref:PEP-CTERM sorting domain-containing protein n=1 Tax=Thalassomonas sp. RHCl1 TaxID=2995320 RepID=UPI00248CEB14|nr:PEP-CTERM sorting domain-containing protein [Thalassomonas sp. RHCl1]
MDKKLSAIVFATTCLGLSATANASEIMFGFVGGSYSSQGYEIASMIDSLDGVNVTTRFLNSEAYDDFDSFDQLWVYDLSSQADKNTYQMANYQGIADWYNNRSAQNLIADGRILSSSSSYTNRGNRGAEDLWIQNYAQQLDAFGGGLVLGTDHNVYNSGINEINKLIGIAGFSGNYYSSPYQAVVDPLSPFYVGSLDECDLSSSEQCINDNSSTGFAPSGLQENGQFLTPVAYHGTVSNAYDKVAVSSSIGSVTFGTQVPEPASLALLGLGLAGVGLRRKKQRLAHKNG